MKTVIVDTTKKDFPKFIWKGTDSAHSGYIECDVQINETDLWRGRVLSMSANGKYTVELMEKSM